MDHNEYQYGETTHHPMTADAQKHLDSARRDWQLGAFSQATDKLVLGFNMPYDVAQDILKGHIAAHGEGGEIITTGDSTPTN